MWTLTQTISGLVDLVTANSSAVGSVSVCYKNQCCVR